MPLNGLNAVAAAAILDNAGVDNELKMRGVLMAAVVQGPLGLLAPIMMANNATTTSPRVTPVGTPATTTTGSETSSRTIPKT